MERQQFEQTLDTIIAYRAEYRDLDTQASAFHIRENTAAEVEPSFRRFEIFAAYSVLRPYVQGHIPEMLEQYTWNDIFNIVSRDISTTAHALSENSTMLSCSLDPKEHSRAVERAAFYALDQEHAASFRFVVPHISLEAIAAPEHPFSVSVASGIVTVSGVDVHSKEHRDALYAFIQETDALSDTLRREHRESDIATLEADLHTYRHAFYDAYNIGEYVRVLKKNFQIPSESGMRVLLFLK